VTEHGKYESAESFPPPKCSLEISRVALQWGRGSLIDSVGNNVTGEQARHECASNPDATERVSG
jgi:hypothetical protein